MSGKEKFIQGLKNLGFEVENLEGNRLAFALSVNEGTLAGKTVRVGVDVPGDFELTAPHGPHIHPRTLPTNTSSQEHRDRIHDSDFGPEWMHLSRPHPSWESSKRNVDVYLAHVIKLLNTL
ncbi:MAG: hypothetical protein A2845_05910 [Candidatus Lloydbacteria bacterium RIFCSPHIGHO2_01_FULL_49_22]|uniref:Uncharacterized protein n=1 Tax=Candidatus Lloydbacteria bacterium RIFCSPHIGHO2_01_FULL_49_22 TaxID=1798658 RepID=A0A1G2CVZ0_9BACT|nr:MAG: hypothetical protein A2845_05910 [Candidatus Lloydbacteria bacterium RIFCSPHIGHO2_01_FULL_49_22]OGZ09786.1 MAG: hypothetical protein A3C14_00105 [Candidatus Lloydbacteria bacterium RIFCSPHIGHO2_02_FULL_50_18]